MVDILILTFLMVCTYGLGFLMGQMNELSNLIGLLEKHNYMTIPQFTKEIKRIYG